MDKQRCMEILALEAERAVARRFSLQGKYLPIYPIIFGNNHSIMFQRILIQKIF